MEVESTIAAAHRKRRPAESRPDCEEMCCPAPDVTGKMVPPPFHCRSEEMSYLNRGPTVEKWSAQAPVQTVKSDPAHAHLPSGSEARLDRGQTVWEWSTQVPKQTVKSGPALPVPIGLETTFDLLNCREVSCPAHSRPEEKPDWIAAQLWGNGPPRHRRRLGKVILSLPQPNRSKAGVDRGQTVRK